MILHFARMLPKILLMNRLSKIILVTMRMSLSASGKRSPSLSSMAAVSTPPEEIGEKHYIMLLLLLLFIYYA